MSKRIKFSGDYPKLHSQTSARLISVLPLTIDDTTPEELLDYDTIKSDGSRYPLHSGEYLQLIFLGNFRIPFCTIRRMSYEKINYYKEGDMFDIIILSENNK